MTLSRRRFLTITAAAAGFGAAARPAPPARWQGIALGAHASLTLHGPPERTGPALRDARAALRRAEALFSLYDPGSALCRLNRDGMLSTPPAEFAALMTLCESVHSLTGGRFDPTVQPVWQALARGAPPPWHLVGWRRVQHTAGTIRLAPGQALTLNGIAQGAATDAARAALAGHGLTRALVNIGEFAALGGPFRIGIADPVHGLTATRSLNGRAIATSAPLATTLAGQPHILAPAGHMPAWSSLSVEAATAALADGLSTGLSLANASQIAALRPALPADIRITATGTDGQTLTL